MTERLRRERWRAASPHLDRALELTGDQRAAWLASLRVEDAALAADVETLLAEHQELKREGFLEGPPPAPPAQASLTGQTIGAYTLRSPIGRGGMGSVWLAERSDGRFQGQAAVKLLNAHLVGHDGEARFRREGSILARLRHPHIAHLIDAGVSPAGQPYLILERVDGERIDRYCDVRNLGVEARLRLFLDVLAAIAHAHANLVVHRDLKPSNVMVGTDGQVKLLDFGIAKLLPAEAQGPVTALTRDGESALTPQYAAPEQLTGGDVTTATDVYALGVLLYVLLTGRHPAGADASTPAELIRAIVDTEAPRVSDAVVTTRASTPETLTDLAAQRATTPRRLRAALKGDLDNILAKTLKKRPSERYTSVDALADDLRRYLGHLPVSARADSLAYRAAKFVRRNRLAVALAAVVVAALTAGLVGTVSQARRANREAHVASEQRDFALRQLSRAEAINDLNAFVLFDAAPLGKPFTAGELLARAERIVEQQGEDPDGNRIELMVAIGRQYDLQDEAAKARRLLEKAYALARVSSDHATRSKAACALANTLAAAGERDRAEQLFQEGLAGLPIQPEFALHRIFCLLRGSQVARIRRDGRTAIERAEAAQRLAGESRFASPLMGHGASMALASAYQVDGRYGEAAALFEEGTRYLSSLGRGETQAAATLFNNRALALRLSGQPLRAEPLFRRAIQLASAGGTEASVSPVVLNNLAAALGDLERLSEAEDYTGRSYRRARELGHEVAINNALFGRTAVYRQQGDLRRAAETLAELAPRLQRMYPAGHTGYDAGLASERAELLRARGNLPAAMVEADRAVALADEASTDRRAFLPLALLRRSRLALELGDLTRAAEDAERALRMRKEAAAGIFSSHLGLAHLAVGRALHAQGKSSESLAAFAAALEHLEPTLGTEHSATRAARDAVASASTDRTH